ncbi:MAG: type VI secretion system baseplate subunit TssF [Ferruginibacter sp.]|nr:type VI secretion system baseplate subunit TssF [Ferruginibacter sp.]
MLSQINNSKEAIRNRMLKHALNFWNIKNTEDLDPVVKLLLEALSTELYNLGNEIKDTESRLLEKAAQLLAPDLLTCPIPAHAILHAIPVEPREVLTEVAHFYLKKKITSSQEEEQQKNMDVFFTPVGKHVLYNVNVICQGAGSNLFGYDDTLNKQGIAQAGNSGGLKNHEMWLGLSVDAGLSEMAQLSFQFEWKNPEFQFARHNFQLLSMLKWYILDKELEAFAGLESEEEVQAPMPKLTSDHDILTQIEQDVKDLYNSRYVTLSLAGLPKLQSLLTEYPLVFKEVFNEQVLQKFNTKLLWIKVVFPQFIPQSALDDLFVYTNTFPVMNRQLNDMRYRLKGGSNIIPLKAANQSQFLAVRSLANDKSQYTITPFLKGEEELGTFTVRSGGVERFDGRNANEFISYLLELLRTESAAFAAYGNDFISYTLKELQQRISIIEQKSKTVAQDAGEIPHYIMVKPMEGNDMMYVEYWTTFAEAGNHIRSGSRLQEYNSVGIKPDSLFLLTTSTGGKDRLKQEERVNAFRYGLMTRNRIVTRDDIRNFCYYELSNRLQKVTIEMGFEISPLQQQGFRRTIDVEITLKKNEVTDPNERQLLTEQLHSKLKGRSGMSNHYRVIIKE